jgi:hypothetical protein
MASTTSPPENAAPVSVRSAKGPRGAIEIDRLFEALVKLSGSDLHLKVGQPPFIRVKGTLQPLKAPKLDDEQMQRLCLPLLDERQQKILEVDGGADFDEVLFYDATQGVVVDMRPNTGSITLVSFDEAEAPRLNGFEGADNSTLVADPAGDHVPLVAGDWDHTVDGVGIVNAPT